MAKYQYISIWKDEGFWNRAGGFLSGIAGFILVTSSYFGDFGRFYYLPVFGFMIVGVIGCTLAEYANKEKTELKNVLLWRTIIYIIPVSIYLTLTENFTNYYSICASIFFSWEFIHNFVFIVFWKNKPVTDVIKKYLWNDTLKISDKTSIKDFSKGEIFGISFMCLVFITICVLLVGIGIFHWEMPILDPHP